MPDILSDKSELSQRNNNRTESKPEPPILTSDQFLLVEAEPSNLGSRFALENKTKTSSTDSPPVWRCDYLLPHNLPFESKQLSSHAYVPPYLVPPYAKPERYENWKRDRKKAEYEASKSLWDNGESLASIYAGAWAAKKFAGKTSVAPQRFEALYDRGAPKSRAVASSFGSTLAATTLEYGLDHVLLPEEQKMEGTVLSDWLVGPAISLSRTNWRTRVCLILSAHLIGRLIDHFRQTPQKP